MITLRRCGLLLIAASCMFLQTEIRGESHPEKQGAAENREESFNKFRLREGQQLVDQLGEFRETGGRITFYPDSVSISLPLLENLALERVARDLDQRSGKWSVTGVVTEYRGANYLLLHRAVQKARSTQTSGVPRS